MDADDDAATIAWAFETGSGEDGTRALESAADRFAWADAIPLCDPTAALRSVRGRGTAAREVMSALLCVPAPTMPAPKLALFVLLAARSYAALYAETLHRKSLQPPTAAPDSSGCARATADQQLQASVRGTMRAWARDLVPILVHTVLPQLQLRDAAPTTVAATHPLNPTAQPELGREETSAASGENDGGHAQQLLMALQTYGVRDGLVRLVEAVHRTTCSTATTPPSSISTSEATLLLLATYATLCNGERCPGASDASVLGRWRTRVLAELREGPTRGGPALGHAPAVEGEVRGADACHRDVAASLSRLCDIASEVHGSALTFAMEALYAGVSSSDTTSTSMSALHGVHVERGSAPSADTAASLAMQHERDVDACTLVATDALDAPPDDAVGLAELPEGVLTLPICREGALLLLADALHLPLTTAGAYSVSAASLLLGVVDSYAAVLRCAGSGVGLLRLLLFLCDVVAAVPKYSVACAGEMRGDAVLGDGGARDFDHCRTRRYEAVFDVAKELLSVSALCPLAEHRRLARVVAAALLERLEETTRIRMQVSLLTLCPYPSIARFFLEQLLRDWREAQPPAPDTESGAATSESPIHVLLPPAVVECARAFLSQLTSGVGGFVDPLVVALNFVRVEVSRRAWLAALRAPPSTGAAVRASRQDAVVSAVAQAWRQLLRLLREQVLPQCHALTARFSAADGNGEVGSAAAAFTITPSLSPLDVFSLSCAVEGLETVLR